MLKFENLKEAQNFILQNGIDQVDVKFTNLFGGLHHITIPASRFSEATISEGIGIDGSSIPGFASIEKSDMVLIPDMKAGFVDPFFKLKTLSFFGSVHNISSKEPFALDSRGVATNAQKLLAGKKYATRSLWGPEYEFYVFNSVNFKNSENISYYEVDSDEAHWNSTRADEDNLGYPIAKGRGYHAIPPKDHLFNFRSDLSILLENAGVDVKYHHHEGGGAGQVEIEVQMTDLLEAGDTGQLVKYFAKMAAFNNNLTVTFMPKPLFSEAGSGMHFHQLLLNVDSPVFFEKDAPYGELSAVALSYIAGILQHSRAIMGLTNPSTNSYKRLTPGFEAPIKAFFSLSNRKAAIRIPAYATLPNEKRMEFRPPDATGNIYLSMSAMLLAGIDGIENAVDPVALKWDSEESAMLLPGSLIEALDSLKNDNKFLIRDGVFSEQLLDSWIKTKQGEDRAVNLRVSPYEIELYYDC
ncbi:MAG: type I glutamate--ammonia ligase [Caldisericaceae bacterium]